MEIKPLMILLFIFYWFFWLIDFVYLYKSNRVEGGVKEGGGVGLRSLLNWLWAKVNVKITFHF